LYLADLAKAFLSPFGLRQLGMGLGVSAVMVIVKVALREPTTAEWIIGIGPALHSVPQYSHIALSASMAARERPSVSEPLNKTLVKLVRLAVHGNQFSGIPWP
jgi:hypothetical protein